MKPVELNILYWIISGTLAIMVLIFIVKMERKAKKELKWQEREKQFITIRKN